MGAVAGWEGVSIAPNALSPLHYILYSIQYVQYSASILLYIKFLLFLNFLQLHISNNKDCSIVRAVVSWEGVSVATNAPPPFHPLAFYTILDGS